MPRLLKVLPVVALLAVSAPVLAQTDSTHAGHGTTVTVSAADDATARARYDEGRALLQEGSHAAALAKFEQGLAANPASLNNRRGAAAALEALGRNDEAVAQLDILIEASIEQGQSEFLSAAREQRSGILYRVSVERAMNAVQNEAEITPELAATAAPLFAAVTQDVPGAGFHYQYARVLNAAGRHAEAIPEAERATQATDVEDKSAFFIELGIALMGTGDTASARAAFEQARTGSWSGWAEHYLRQLDAPADTTTGG